MPRYTSFQLRWSEQAQSYVLFNNDQVTEQVFSYDWLEQNPSFSFYSRWGMHYTVRKQKVQRGGGYWYAYRRLYGRIVKRYLGRTVDLTLTRLEEVAGLLESLADSPQASLGADQEMVLTPSVPLTSNEKNTVSLAPVETLPLLVSKLSPPGLHAFLLDRSRLFALLDTGREGPFTLISAPAGFGKTTLVCQWIAARHTRSDFPPVAWLSLEVADNDPLRFWRYVLAACQKFQVDLSEVHSAVQALTPQPPFVPSSLETMLTLLINALTQCPSQSILVLEDYHVITDTSLQNALAFFVDHLPANFHLIMITRNDPPFSLARLRARNMLYEIRTADLRFTEEETMTLLHHALPFSLKSSTIRSLHEQLQGWGVGLHLVKLALQRTTSSAEREQILTLFARNNSFVQEYFVTEVLAMQPQSVQQFLLKTCILTRLTGSLCDFILEQDNSQDILTLLERDNLFLERLDTTSSQQQWYRYHELFSEAMRNEARYRLGEVALHRLSLRASHWYESHGFLHEAIDTALSVQEYERAATLITYSINEQALPGELYEPHTLLRWLQQLPEAILQQYPVLCLCYATTLLFRNTSWRPDAQILPLQEKLLGLAEQGFRQDNNLLELGELLAFRALLALRLGDTSAARLFARQALDWLVPPQIQRKQYVWRGLSLSIVAEEWIATGSFDQALATLLEAQTLCDAVKNRYFQRIALLKLALVFFEQGKIQQATSSYRQVLAEAREEGPVYVVCAALVGLAVICYEQNDLESAYGYVQETIAVSQSHQLLYYEVQANLVLARVQQAWGQIVVAQQQLTALFARMPASLPHLVQEIKTAQARLALSIGDHMTLQRWAMSRLPLSNFLDAREEELLYSRWLRIQGKLDDASRELEQMLVIARQAKHLRFILEVQVEMVLVAFARKYKIEALQLLHEVLALAFERNAMRLFLDAGEQMALLLRSLLPQIGDQALLAYIRALLSAFPVQQQDNRQAQVAGLIEPLSPQEMRVLRLLAQHRSNAEIANELVVSVNTVRSQVQSIYSKLGVHNRGAASAVARELRLIS